MDARGRAYEPVTLKDGTTAEVAVHGEWAYVRMPSGREGRVPSSALEQFLAGGGPSPERKEEAMARLRRGMRLTLWQLLAFVGLLLTLAGALILLQLI